MSKYVKLFEVDILHDYFLNLNDVPYEALSDDLKIGADKEYMFSKYFEIRPTESTEKILAGHQMLFKKTKKGFFVAVSVNSMTLDIRPLISLSSEFKLLFSLKIIDNDFFNYTSLKTSAPNFYIFKNNSGNSIGDDLFLSNTVEFFDSDEEYEADQIFAETSGTTVNLFRAIRTTGPSATPITDDWEQFPHDTFDATTNYSMGSIVLMGNQLYRAIVANPGLDLTIDTDWQQFSMLSNQYVTESDSLMLHSKHFNIDISTFLLSDVTVKINRYGESNFVWQNTFTSNSGDLDELQLNLQNLSNDHYQLQIFDSTNTLISDSGFDFYLDSTAIRESWFGVVHIELGDNSFSLLEDDGTLRSPKYMIRFMNRASRWRYIFPQDQQLGAGSEVAVDSGDNRILVTELPKPLTRYGNGILLQADLSETAEISEEVILPKPETKRIRYQDAQWYSEMHMSNLTL